jgi:hypothetical protein
MNQVTKYGLLERKSIDQIPHHPPAMIATQVQNRPAFETEALNSKSNWEQDLIITDKSGFATSDKNYHPMATVQLLVCFLMFQFFSTFCHCIHEEHSGLHGIIFWEIVAKHFTVFGLRAFSLVESPPTFLDPAMGHIVSAVCFGPDVTLLCIFL